MKHAKIVWSAVDIVVAAALLWRPVGSTYQRRTHHNDLSTTKQDKSGILKNRTTPGGPVPTTGGADGAMPCSS